MELLDKIALNATDDCSNARETNEIKLLDLELALVGGGIADVVF